MTRARIFIAMLTLAVGGTALAFPEQRRAEWPSTDFSNASVPLAEIVSGGPPRDGIPPIDDPDFVPVPQATGLADTEPVIGVTVNGAAKAYPLRILIWHEIVNDNVGGVPVAVTFCPLCNAAMVFDRRAGARVLDFGTTGMLRHSDLVMYDRQTETWWQQATGVGIVGGLTGAKLEFVPSQIVGLDQFAEAHPDGVVLSRDTGFSRDYGRNPYVGYDTVDQQPFLFQGLHLNDACRTAHPMGHHRGIAHALSFANIDHPKRPAFIEAQLDHLLITILKDVQRQGHAWKKNRI